MANLKLVNVCKQYKNGVIAVKDFNIDISDGEFIVLVGPSGCGKSTTLRMIAGLEEISSGDLYIDNEYMNDIEPKNRNLAMVFQNYALYPYLTVYENIAFGLKLRKTEKTAMDKKVHDVAKMLGIEEYLNRKPAALSGGQRQRVAVGRAIVRDAKIYLFDEPLSNLDAKLRAQMRVEITRLHAKLNTTFIYVTHDQVEAMTMGTRIVVMKDGVVQQIDTPSNLYDYPVNQFVAGFIGTPQMNFFNAKLTKKEKYELLLDNESIPFTFEQLSLFDNFEGEEVVLGLRCEDFHIASSDEEAIQARVCVIESLGNECLVYLRLSYEENDSLQFDINKDTDFVMKISGRCHYKIGEELNIAIDKSHVHLFDRINHMTIIKRGEE